MTTSEEKFKKWGVGLQEEIQELRVKLQHLEEACWRDSNTTSVSDGALSSTGFFRFRTCVWQTVDGIGGNLAIVGKQTQIRILLRLFNPLNSLTRARPLVVGR